MLPVARTIHREEAMTGIVVPMELVDLPELFEFRFGYVHILWRRSPVLVAKESKQRTLQVLGVVDRGNGLTPGEFLRFRHHTTTVATNRGVDPAQRARRQVHLPATGTIANDTH